MDANNASFRVSRDDYSIQRSGKVGAPGLVDFIPAVAYHLCLNLLVAFSQIPTSIISGPSHINLTALELWAYL